MVFDAESKSVLHTEMAKKNLFVKRGKIYLFNFILDRQIKTSFYLCGSSDCLILSIIFATRMFIHLHQRKKGFCRCLNCETSLIDRLSKL